MPWVALQAASVEAWSIGSVNRTDSFWLQPTSAQPFRGRNRTTAGTAAVWTVSAAASISAPSASRVPGPSMTV